MGVPQDSRARRIAKKRRTKKLAKWREKQAAGETGSSAAKKKA